MLTIAQKQALQMMASKNVGAIVTRFGWTWPEDVRQSEEKAFAVISRMEVVYADCNSVA